MKYRYIIPMFCLALMASCQKEKYDGPDKDKYIYDIPQTTLPGAVVGCYYSSVSTGVDAAKSAEEPLLGYYKTTDPEVMPRHIAWADQAGLDFFIFSWDGSSTETALLDNFKASLSGESSVKMVVKYKTGHLTLTNDTPLQSSAKYNAMLTDFVDILVPYLQDDNYYKIDGKPVLVLSPANLSSDALVSADYSKVIPQLRNDLQSIYGIDLYIIGEMATGWVAPVNYPDHSVYSFDALTLTSWKTRSYDIFYGFFSFLDINMNNWKTTLGRRNVDFVPCIYPSYNDRVSDKKSYYYTFSEDGDTGDFIKFCNVAKRNAGTKNVVLINGWNDWNNGANLEPSTLKETKFLDECRKQLK